MGPKYMWFRLHMGNRFNNAANTALVIGFPQDLNRVKVLCGICTSAFLLRIQMSLCNLKEKNNAHPIGDKGSRLATYLCDFPCPLKHMAIQGKSTFGLLGSLETFHQEYLGFLIISFFLFFYFFE